MLILLVPRALYWSRNTDIPLALLGRIEFAPRCWSATMFLFWRDNRVKDTARFSANEAFKSSEAG